MIEWAQRNVAFTRPGGDPRPAARALFASLAPRIDALRSDGTVELFFFQRKPPDVRLRFGRSRPLGGEGGEPDWFDAALDPIDRALDALVGDGTLQRWFPSPYEPETRKLGGDGSAAAVHRHFDADTTLWMTTQGADGNLPLEMAPAELAATLADDLFVRVLRDRDEVWDTWANLAELASPPDPALTDGLARWLDDPRGGEGLAPLAGPEAPRTPGPLRSLAASAAPSAADALERLAGEHDALAGAVAAEAEAGRLRVGPRAVLPFVAQLDLQRWGLGGPQQGAVAAVLMAAWDPTSGFRQA